MSTSPDVDRRHIVLPVRWVVTGCLVALLLVAGAVAGWAAVDNHRKTAAASGALDAARDYTLLLANIDPDTVDEHLDELRAATTEKLNAMHVQDAERIRRIILDKKVVARGDIVDATVESAGRDRVEVVLIVDQTISDVDAPTPETERKRVTIVMDRVEGRWLASKVDL